MSKKTQEIKEAWEAANIEDYTDAVDLLIDRIEWLWRNCKSLNGGNLDDRRSACLEDAVCALRESKHSKPPATVNYRVAIEVPVNLSRMEILWQEDHNGTWEEWNQEILPAIMDENERETFVIESLMDGAEITSDRFLQWVVEQGYVK